MQHSLLVDCITAAPVAGKHTVNCEAAKQGWMLLQDAMQSLSNVVDTQPDAQAAFNLVLCTFALGDKETMKQAFTRLVEVCFLFYFFSPYKTHLHHHDRHV